MFDEHANSTGNTRLNPILLQLQRSVYRWLSGEASIFTFITGLAWRPLVAMEGQPDDFGMGHSPFSDILHLTNK